MPGINISISEDVLKKVDKYKKIEILLLENYRYS